MTAKRYNALFVSSLLLSVFRLLLNAIDHSPGRKASVVGRNASRRNSSQIGLSLAQNPQWRERLQFTLDFIGTKGDLNPF